MGRRAARYRRLLRAVLLDAARLDHARMGPAGGVLAAIEFGPLNQWMNTYWGGGVTPFPAAWFRRAAPPAGPSAPTRRPAAGTRPGAPSHHPALRIDLSLRERGSLVSPGVANAIESALPGPPAAGSRIRSDSRRGSGRGAEQSSHGQLDHHARNAQPVSVRRALGFHLPAQSGAALPAHAQQAMDYKMQLGFHGPAPIRSPAYLLRLEYRVRYYRFFFPVPLYIALAAFLAVPPPVALCLGLRSRWRCSLWASISSRPFSFTTSPPAPACSSWRRSPDSSVWPHPGLRLARRKPAARASSSCALLHFAFWYTLHALEDRDIFPRRPPV